MRKVSDNANTQTSAKAKNKSFGMLLRASVVIVLIAVVGFSAFFVADFLSSDDDKGAADIITVTILGSTIKLGDSRVVTIAELDEYLRELDEEGDLSTVALIVDSANPPDVGLHNRVVALLREYGIEADEIAADVDGSDSSPDEVSTPDEL